MPFFHCVIKCNCKKIKNVHLCRKWHFLSKSTFEFGESALLILCIANKKIQRTAKLAGFKVVLIDGNLKTYIANLCPQIYHRSKLDAFGFSPV